MVENDCWDVDRLAASRLLASLKLEPTAEILQEAARHLARHRRESSAFSAERVRAKIVEDLEARSVDHLRSGSKSHDWAMGVGFAELRVASLDLDDVTDQGLRKPRSKGTILRSMVREARKDDASYGA